MVYGGMVGEPMTCFCLSFKALDRATSALLKIYGLSADSVAKVTQLFNCYECCYDDDSCHYR